MADRFEDSPLANWARQSKNPAAPSGAQQMAQNAGRAAQGESGFAQSKLAQWAEAGGGAYRDQARGWYTGANMQGTNNGWDNTFAEKFMRGYDKAAEEGTLNTYFEQPDATGVVLWDHDSQDGTKRFTFGDVYEDGKKLGNVYEDYGQEDADLMMSTWAIPDPKVQAKIFGSDDIPGALRRELQSIREQNTKNVAQALAAQEFQGKVDERQASMGTTGEVVAVGGSTLAGTATGAGIGSVIAPGPGTLIGGGIGAATSFIGSMLNRDSLTESMARAWEITAARNEESGWGAAAFEGIGQWSGVAGRFVQPLSNIVEGGYDLAAGEIGDGESAYYRIDPETGKNETPTWLKVAHLGASIGDMGLQFASPTGAAMFQAQMVGQIGGNVGSLTFSGGESWDDRRGGFDNIFTDEEGNFDLMSAAAGIGVVGIDAIQLGIGRGLMSKADSSLAELGKQGVYSQGFLGRIAGPGVGAPLTRWTEPKAVRDAVAAGATPVERAGVKFFLDDAGKVVASRKTVSLLAPSEQLSNVSARVIARRTAAKTHGGAYTVDDFYRAANSLAMGEKKLNTALVTGFGEGYEELAQAVLEPISHGASVDGHEMAQAFLYGSAGGIGMGLGAGFNTSTAAQKMQKQAEAHFLARTGTEAPSGWWDALTQPEKNAWLASGQIQDEVLKAAYKKVVSDQAAEAVAGVAGVARLADALQSDLDKKLAKNTPRTDGSFVITQIEDVALMPSDAVASSAAQLMANLENHRRGIEVSIQSLTQDLQGLMRQQEAQPENAELQERVARLQRSIEIAQRVRDVLPEIMQTLDSRMDEIHAADTTPERRAAIAEANQYLRDLFYRSERIPINTQLPPEEQSAIRDAMQRAVSLVFGRDPFDQDGSFQILLPQISEQLTQERADNVLQVSHAILMPLSGDFDGDKIRQLAQLVLDDDSFTNLRTGTNVLGANGTVGVGTPKYEVETVKALSTAYTSGRDELKDLATNAMTTIGDGLRRRYDGYVEDVVLDQVLDPFFDAMKAGSKDARQTLLDGLAKKAGSAITRYARDHMSNEWYWIDHLIVEALNEFQYGYATNRRYVGAPDTSTPTPYRRSSEIREQKIEQAATLGNTLALLLPGDSPFRAFQKLHFTSITSNALAAEELSPNTRSELRDLAMLYESLGSGITEQQLSAIQAKDAISARVMVQLQSIAEDFRRQYPNIATIDALSVVANMSVLDIDIAPNGEVSSSGKEVTLTQMLLKMSLQKDRREKDAIWEMSPELQAKHARLMAYTRPGSGRNRRGRNAEHAFVEVVGSQQLINLLGEDSVAMGAHRTVEQYLRGYISQSPLSRRRRDVELKRDGAYLGRREETKSIPYSIEDVVAGKVNGYRAVVDSILAVGHDRITMDLTTGEIKGELAERSAKVGEDLRTGIQNVRAALMEYLNMDPRKDGELTVEAIHRLLDSRPDLAAPLMKLIPDSAVHGVFFQRPNDERVYIANWVYEMFTFRDPKEAEMFYWRNILLAELNAMQANDWRHRENPDEVESRLEYGRLPRRIHRVIYRLSKQRDAGLQLQSFMDKLVKAKDLDAFFRELNKDPMIRGEQAPLVPWFDDVAEFDADKAGGGWTTMLQGSELREAISSLRDSSTRLVDDLSREREEYQADIPVMQAIRRVLRYDAGDTTVTLDSDDRTHYNRFVKAIEQAGDRYISFGPSAMIHQSVAAVWGFYAQAHTKVKNPDHINTVGLFDAMRDAYDYTANFERVMAGLTSVNLDAVGNNLSQAAKDDVRSMDEYGRVVTHSKPDPETMLNLLENVETRSAARAMLFPQVIERTVDGQVSTQMLHGRSLNSLLNGTTYNDLFPHDGKLSRHSALKYASTVEAYARAHGGHAVFQRQVNDVAIARLSSATHVLTIGEVEDIVIESYETVAKLLQAAATLDMMPPTSSSDPLAEVVELARESRRQQVLGSLLKTDASGTKLVDSAIDQLVSQRDTELKQRANEILAEGGPDALTQAEAIADDIARMRERAELLKSNSSVQQVVQMFSFSTEDMTTEPAIKRKLTDYFSQHLSMMQRVPAATQVLRKLSAQMLDDTRQGQYDLFPDEWTTLSNAVISHYLTERMERSAPTVSVPVFPVSPEDQKYFDHTFSYLVESIFSRGPLLEAAKYVQRDLAGRLDDQELRELPSEVVKLINSTLFKKGNFGEWTGDIPRASMDANARLNSAAAPPATSMIGNSPKRQAIISAATRRTFAIPGEELLSTTTISANTLNRPVLDDEFPVVFPGATEAVNRPLAQLNNRFARGVVGILPDGTEVDLRQYPNTAWSWPSEKHPEVARSGYGTIHTSRVWDAVVRAADEAGVKPEQMQVRIEFFHPDSQPADWMHNLFFEGTSFQLDGDFYNSLNESLWFSPSGINQTDQRTAIDSSKLGLPALRVANVPSSADRVRTEAEALVDLAATLRAKTKIILQTDMAGGDDGKGLLEPEYYNAIYKNLKLRHFVRGMDENGSPVMWTAEQTIAFQQQNPGTPLPIQDAELYVMSDTVLRSFLGERGTQGVSRIFPEQLEVDLTAVPQFTGVTQDMIDRFAPGIALGEKRDLFQTSITARTRQQQAQVRTRVTSKELSAFDEKIRYQRQLQAEILTDRALLVQSGQTNFNAENNLNRALNAGLDMIAGGSPSLDLGRYFGIVGPTDMNGTNVSTLLLKDLNAAIEATSNRTGWTYVEGAAANPAMGTLSQVSLSDKGPVGLRVAPGDLVVIDMASFNEDLELAKKRIDFFMGRGAMVVLSSSDGGSLDLQDLGGRHMLASGYEKVAGSKHLYQQADLNTRYQNQRARLSTLMETRGVAPRHHTALMLVRGRNIEENAAWRVRQDDETLSTVSAVVNLLPLNAWGTYNAPVDTLMVNQNEFVRTKLKNLDDAGRELLKEMSLAPLRQRDGEEDPVDPNGIAQAERDFDESWRRLMQRLDDHDGSVMPQAGDEFKVGDFIPLIDQTNKRILLYRHGHQAPLNQEAINEMQARVLPGELDGLNIAVYSARKAPSATVVDGTVVSIEPRAEFGMQIRLNVDLQQLGDKKVLELNGMKYILTGMPAGISVPEHGFFENMGISLISDQDSAFSKQSFDGVVNNFRNAFAYFGVDFLPDLAKFFFPGQTYSAEVRTLTLELLKGIQSLPKITREMADEILHQRQASTTLQSLLANLPQGSSWSANLDDSTVEAPIARAAIVYLLTEGNDGYEAILSSGGFNDDTSDPDRQSRLMPQLFTQVFDDAPFGSPLRKEMFSRFNKQLYNPKNDGTGYFLQENWDFETRMADPSQNLTGLLQFAEVFSAGDNPEFNGMAFDTTMKQRVSRHSASIAYQATGAYTSARYDLSAVMKMPEQVIDFAQDAEDGGLWRLMNSFAQKDKSMAARWRQDTPLETSYRSLAREAMVSFLQPIEKTEETGWDKKQIADYTEKRTQILQALNLTEAQADMVDGWVRQVLGMPAGTSEDLTGRLALGIIDDIAWNVNNRYLPTIGGAVPLMDVMDLQQIYRANEGRANGWSPRSSLDMNSPLTGAKWDAWVETTLGAALASDTSFDRLFLTATDGMMHTYQNATDQLSDLPVSLAILKSMELLNPKNNNDLVSLSPDVARVNADPLVSDATRATLEDLLGGDPMARMGTAYRGELPRASVLAERARRRKAWRLENGVPIPVEVSMRDFRKNGTNFVQHSTTTNSLIRMMTSLRVGTALLNPALWISFGPEAMVRGVLDKAANVVSGQTSSGMAARMQAAAAEWLRGTPLAAVYERTGLAPQFTSENLQQLEGFYESASFNNAFKSMVFKELDFQRPHVEGVSRPEKWLANYARLGAKWQDPTYGIRPKTLAKIYFEAAWQHISATPDMTPMSLETLISGMRENPLFLANNNPDAHRAGINAIAQRRSLKATTASVMLKSIYEPLSAHENMSVNILSNVLLKIPMIFSTYATNVMTAVLGLQGFSDLAAMAQHGRQKGGLMLRIQSMLSGRPVSDLPQTYDFGEVLEGIDLSRSFIRGGLTHTGLFAIGMMMAGGGLLGEDDEERRRRLAAEQQGAVYVRDPRKLQADFRNADALYSDGLPFQMPWMAKQFVSPFVGIGKFLNTGDFRHVTWGFEDALGSFPLINTMSWKDAVETAHMFVSDAEEAGADGTPEGAVKAAGFLTQAVATYERMLFENSFVNQLYQMSDRYDRDPYAAPLRDSDGDLQLDAEGQPRKTTALQQYRDPETGEVREGYINRSNISAQLHSYTENRATLAAALSLFSGVAPGENDWFRHRQVIKTRKMEREPMSADDARAMVQAISTMQGGMQNLTTEEALAWLRAQPSTNKYTSNADLLPQAKQMAEAAGTAPMSVIDPKTGAEHLTNTGARAVLDGLAKGSVQLTSASLQGIYIPFEMRQEIQRDWMQELIQEGIDMGLDESKATKRMQRLWNGPYEDPTVQGLGDILWSDQISYSQKLEYKQLNTTYVTGPDGRPWATGYERNSFNHLRTMLGLQVPLKGGDRLLQPEDGGMDVDDRFNSVDLVNRVNTGLRALEPMTPNVPTDEEIGKSIEEAMKEAASKTYTPFQPFDNNSTGGGGYRRGRGGGGGGGSYYSGGYPNFIRMSPFPDQRSVYGNTIPMINTSNPIIRRADIRRERVWSERGRLKQWQ